MLNLYFVSSSLSLKKKEKIQHGEGHNGDPGAGTNDATFDHTNEHRKAEVWLVITWAKQVSIRKLDYEAVRAQKLGATKLKLNNFEPH